MEPEQEQERLLGEKGHNVPPYRVGIVGCGRIASTREDGSPVHPSTIAGAFDALDNCELVAACNRGKERLDMFGERWGVSALYHDPVEMLANEGLDIVAVATPPPVHPENVIAAAEAGAKGIFCEKPMALGLGECDAMIDACDKAGTKLLVNCTRRWYGTYEAARRAVQNEEPFGPLLHMVGWCQGCKPLPEWEAEHEGPMLHDTVHLFDIMRFFAGDVDWLIGTAPRRVRHEFRVEDAGMIIFQFKSGIDAVAISGELTEYARFEIELHFERGVLRLGLDNVAFESRRAPTQETWWYRLYETEFPEQPWDEQPILVGARDLVGAIEEDRECRCNGHDGRAAIEMISAIYESERRGNEKVHFPFDQPRRMLDVMREDGVY